VNDTWWVKQKQLDDDQKRVFTLPMNQDHLIQGPPGSGKTNLLLLRAKQLAGSGHPDVIIVVHTRTLQEFIRAGAAGYGLSGEKVVTFRKLALDLLYRNGASISLPNDFDKARTALVDALQAQLAEGRLNQEYSCVLVDEAQDFLPGEIALLRAIGERFFGVADARQKIYTGQDAVPNLEAAMNTVTLRFHYRTGRKICTVADSLAKSLGKATLLHASKYDESSLPSSVDVVSARPLVDQCKELLSRLDTQLKAYPMDMIGVVCPRGEDADKVIGHLRSSVLGGSVIAQRFDDGYEAFGPGKRICVSALHSAKGLEFRAVHILAAEGLKKFPMQRRLAFMGVTRAKTSLTMYHEGDLPGYLESAVAQLNPVTKMLGLENLLDGEDESGSPE
jgi:superfamily I DNA/RNA helicase